MSLLPGEGAIVSPFICRYRTDGGECGNQQLIFTVADDDLEWFRAECANGHPYRATVPGLRMVTQPHWTPS